ncbi:hypothetical protein AB433_09265 [Croceicoccus naphthovorans]|uniref:N-acetyltransferase domain-containing protein n=1 Tax=Croceicoccus naphthovorans TaxID=1348774 RepID=A0A0G3XJH0_9SPHN|nr:hypothetical protein AB433_09265 [Croceicoccus naphthovorans]
MQSSGTVLSVFTADDAANAHVLMARAYADGGGSVGPFDAWWSALSSDAEYDPKAMFAIREGGRLVGFVHCWSSGFIKDLVVAPEHQRQGLGRALVLRVFEYFTAAGREQVRLKVLRDNDKAIAFYRSLGMRNV